MESMQKSFGEWLSSLPVALVQGVVWLYETIPLTSIVVLPLGFILVIIHWTTYVSTNWLIGFSVIMLIDGYIGHRRTKREEQQMMRDFYRWHAEELEKDKGEQ